MEAASRAYKGDAEAKANLEQKTQQYQGVVQARQENLEKKEKISSVAAGVVSGAQGLMQAAAAGESIKALTTSLVDGTATFGSALTGLTSSIMQSAMGFSGLNSALGMIPGLSAGAAGGIALAVTALLALASTAVDVYDRMTVSD